MATLTQIPQNTQNSQHNTQWATSLCNCCSDPRQSSNQCQFFCCSLFCQPCAQGQLQQHAGLADNCCLPCCFYSIFSSTAFGMLVPYISLFNLDRAVIEKENISEGCFCTLCKVLCCFPCAMNQLNNHFILKNEKFEVGSSSCNCMHLMGCVGDAGLVTAVPQSDLQPTVAPVMSNTMLVRPSQFTPMLMPPPPMLPSAPPMPPYAKPRLVRPASTRSAVPQVRTLTRVQPAVMPTRRLPFITKKKSTNTKR